MVCCSANPVICDGTDAAASVHQSLPTLISNKAAISPTVLPVVSQTYRHARDQCVSVRAAPMKLRGLNLAIPCAVQSGFRYPAFAFSAWPSLPTS
jgi:hypothetical protein